mgnify:CR=1 FL=1
MITTGNTIVSIYTEMTPNPETMKFVANKLLYPGKSIDIADESQATPSPIAKELFAATILLIDKQTLIPKIEAIRSNIGDKVHAALVHGIDTDQVGVVGGNLEYILKHISEYPQQLDNGVIALVVGGKKKENSPEEDSKNARGQK